MGCDIHAYAEIKTDAGYEALTGVDVFKMRNYNVFEFLAGVRSSGTTTPLAEPRGLPSDASEFVKNEHHDWGWDAHSASWLALDELLRFDYDQPTRNPLNGKTITVRKFLASPSFFDDLAKMQAAGADRVVFWFDN